MAKQKKVWKPGKKGCITVVLALMLITLPALADRSMAQTVPAQSMLSWSAKPLSFSYDHVAYVQDPNRLEGVGVAYKVLYGALGQLTLGANTFELGLMSFGVGTGNTEEPSRDASAFGSVGFVFACTDLRGICGDMSFAKNADGDAYVLSAIFRIGALAVATAPAPVASATPARSTGLDSMHLQKTRM